MARRKKHTPEQIVSLLRQIEVVVANRQTMAQASKEALITEQTYYRWRAEFGGLQVDQALRLKELDLSVTLQCRLKVGSSSGPKENYDSFAITSTGGAKELNALITIP
jgi:Transposase